MERSLKRKEMMFNVGTICIGALFILGLYMLFPSVFAAEDDTPTKTVINIIVKIFRVTAVISGVVLILVGAFKYGMAHANENGPDEQKARGMIIGGIVLTLLFSIIITDNVINQLVGIIEKQNADDSSSSVRIFNC